MQNNRLTFAIIANRDMIVRWEYSVNFRFFSNLTMDIIAQCAFGVELSIQEHQDSLIPYHANKIFNLSFVGFRIMFLGRCAFILSNWIFNQCRWLKQHYLLSFPNMTAKIVLRPADIYFSLQQMGRGIRQREALLELSHREEAELLK